MRASGTAALVLLLACAGARAATPPPAPDQPVTVTASVEPDTATVGDRLTLRLRVERPEGVRVTFPDVAKLVPPLEVLGNAAIPNETREGRAVEERVYILAAFETGRARVPAMQFAFVDAKGDSGTVLSDSLAVFVKSVLPGGEEKPQPKDIKPPVELPRHVWPFIVGAAAVVAALLGLRYLRKWWRSRRKPARKKVEEPVVPRHAAHLVAFERLTALEREDPIGRGDVPAFYVAVTGILRLYVRDRFAVDAIDMTTSELGPAMRSARMEEGDIGWTVDYLAHADLAKFAKHVPTPERARDDFRGAWDFVERTRFRGEAPPDAEPASSGEPATEEAPRC
jgi:hypothetical protein